MKLNVDEVERDVAVHEKTQTMQPIKTIIKSFASTFVRYIANSYHCCSPHLLQLRKKSVSEPPETSAPYKPPTVFSTDAFFPKDHSTL